MKRVNLILLCVSVVGVLAAPSLAGAAPIRLTFGDISTSWGYVGIPVNPSLPYQPDNSKPNYNPMPSGVSFNQEGKISPWNYPPGGSPPTNLTDQYGTPLFNINNQTGGENAAYFDATTKKLHQVTIAYHNVAAEAAYWRVLKPGDLFIDVNGNGTWDYVARTPFFDNATYFTSNGDATNGAATHTPGNTAGHDAQTALWHVYKFTLPETDPGLPYLNDQDLPPSPGHPHGTEVFVPYQVAANTTPADGGTWNNDHGVAFSIRDYHPWALNWDSPPPPTEMQLTDITATFSGWANLSGTAGTGTSTWTFSSDLDVGLTGTMRIGFTVNCANEVLLGDVPHNLGPPVPEPASLLIWSIAGGVGAAGLALKRRRESTRWSDENRQAILEVIQGRRR